MEVTNPTAFWVIMGVYPILGWVLLKRPFWVEQVMVKYVRYMYTHLTPGLPLDPNTKKIFLSIDQPADTYFCIFPERLTFYRLGGYFMLMMVFLPICFGLCTYVSTW